MIQKSRDLKYKSKSEEDLQFERELVWPKCQRFDVQRMRRMRR
jgi:hypothetical protein